MICSHSRGFRSPSPSTYLEIRLRDTTSRESSHLATSHVPRFAEDLFAGLLGRFPLAGDRIAGLVPNSQGHKSVLQLHRLQFTVFVESRKTEFSAVSGFFVPTGGQGEVRIPVRRFAFLRTFQLKRALPATTQGSAPLPRGPPMPDSSLLAPWSHFFRRTRDGA